MMNSNFLRRKLCEMDRHQWQQSRPIYAVDTYRTDMFYDRPRRHCLYCGAEEVYQVEMKFGVGVSGAGYWVRQDKKA